MSKRGKATKIRGIYESDEPNKWVLRTLGVTETVVGSLVDAHNALEKLRERLRKGDQPTPNLTVGASAPQWLAALKARKPNTKPAFFADRIRILETYILPFWGEHVVNKVTSRDIVRWKLWLSGLKQVAGGNKGQPYSQGTLQTAWSTFKTLWVWACIEAQCSNVMLGLRFDLEHDKKAPKDFLTQDELVRVLGALRETASPDMYVLITCLFSTGARFAEVSALHWEDIDFTTGTARIVRSQVDGVAGKPKTESTRRLVYLMPAVVELLRRHKEWQLKEGPRLPVVAGTKCFPSSLGSYRQPSVVRKPLKAACLQAGVAKHLTAHCGRKTANVLLLAASDTVMTRAIIGHSDAASTFTYFGADADARRAATAKAFGDAFEEVVPELVVEMLN